jgi:hypothetical protein
MGQYEKCTSCSIREKDENFHDQVQTDVRAMRLEL